MLDQLVCGPGTVARACTPSTVVGWWWNPRDNEQNWRKGNTIWVLERRTVDDVSYSKRGLASVAMAVLAASLVVASCTDSGGSNQLERIDGPAQVDPDFSGIDDGTVVQDGEGSNESESGG